jgi:hypothetical protein
MHALDHGRQAHTATELLLTKAAMMSPISFAP